MVPEIRHSHLEQFPFHDRLRALESRWLHAWRYDVGAEKNTPDEEKKKSSHLPLMAKWTGTLSQSDRDYGFYFEADPHEGRRGQSYIVSEYNGGSAFQNWNRRYDSIFQLLSFKELEVVSKTDPRWQWCIKSGTLLPARSQPPGPGRRLERFYRKGMTWIQSSAQTVVSTSKTYFDPEDGAKTVYVATTLWLSKASERSK